MTTLQSGDLVDQVLVEAYANGGSNVGPGGVAASVSCPSGYYVTGGGYEFSAATTPSAGFRAWFNGPVSGWGALGTAWSVSGETDVAGTLRVWALCVKLT